MPGARVPFDLTENLESIHFGKLDVEQNELQVFVGIAVRVVAAGKEEIERLLPITHNVNAIAHFVLSESAKDQKLIIWVVLHEKYLDLTERHRRKINAQAAGENGVTLRKPAQE